MPVEVPTRFGDTLYLGDKREVPTSYVPYLLIANRRNGRLYHVASRDEAVAKARALVISEGRIFLKDRQSCAPRPRRRALSGTRARWTIHPRGATFSASRLCLVWPAARGRLFTPRGEHRRGGGHLGVRGLPTQTDPRIDDEGAQG